MCQYLHAVLSHHEGVLPLCARLLVARDNLPAILVVCINEHLPRTHVDHRLDGEHHARHKQHTRTLVSVVHHVGLLVELQSNAMTAEVAHNALFVI